MKIIPRVVLATACLLALPALTPNAAPAQAVGSAASFVPAEDDNHLRFFGETNGGDATQQEYTQAQAVALARRYDVIIGLRWTFDNHLAAMRAANPDLTIFVYMNGAMSKTADAVSMPEDWFMHDANGNRVRNINFPLLYMDVGNAGWRNWVAQRCTDWLILSGFDGCWLDDMGAGNIPVNLSAWPIDPRTGQEIREYDWITYAKEEFQVVAAANPGTPISFNGLNSGSKYFLPVEARRLLETGDAGTAEGWLRSSRVPAGTFRSVARWQQDVDMLVHAGELGKEVFAGTKIWVPSTSAQKSQWRQYTYASFMLGTNGDQFLFFSTSAPGKADPVNAMDSFNLGTPTEAYALRNGVYQRRFTAGLAMVNPGNTTVNVTLDASYRLPDGRVVTTLSLPPHTGRLLRTV